MKESSKMGQSSTTQTQSLPGWQEDFLRDTVLPTAQGIADTPFTAYTGQFAPEMSALQTQAGAGYQNLASMTPDQYAAQTSANMNPYQQQVIDTSLAQMNRSADQARTGLEANIAGSGAFGSRGQVALGEFDAGVQSNRDALIANAMQQGYANAQGLTQQQIANQYSALGGMGNIGAQQTALDAANLTGQYGEFMREQQYPYQQLQGLLGAGAGNYGGTTTNTQQRGLFDFLGAGASLFM